MKTRFLGTAGTVAGLLLCIGIAPNVYAQQTVLNILGGETDSGQTPDFKNVTDGSFSTFTFQQSFILNSIGFTTGAYWQFDSLVKEYKIGDSPWVTVTDQLTRESNGVGYYTFTNPQTYAAGTQISIKGLWGNENKFRKFDAINVAGITHSTSQAGYASGNLRVTALDPGSNVAPEPGSFALALTGGAALLGICVRRRRNAG
jgi:hypothetical protein